MLSPCWRGDLDDDMLTSGRFHEVPKKGLLQIQSPRLCCVHPDAKSRLVGSYA